LDCGFIKDCGQLGGGVRPPPFPLEEYQMSNCFSRVGATGALIFALAAGAYGQTTTTGAITGTVLDTGGAAISGSTITIRDKSTNAEKKAAADQRGFFNILQLQPGQYTLTISAPGFANYEVDTVEVEVGQSTTLHPALAVASAGTQTVQVSGAAPLINTTGPDFATNLGRKEIESIPINGRRWSDLTLLTPGVVADSNGFGLLSIRGISPLLNNVEIDGADDNQAFFSEERGRTREGYSTPQVAIQEFQVNTGVYSTEYGRALGGVINSVTKSGGNQMHGELYFYDRDNDWGAKNPFTKLTTFDSATGTNTTVQYKPKNWRKQAGFGVGGPIIKDKLFWFYTFDAFRQNFPGVAVASNPAAFFKAPDGALPSGYSCSTILSSAGSTQPTNPVDAQVCALQTRLGLASYGAALTLYNTDLGALSNQLGTVPRYGDQDINMPKLDWQVNGRNHVSFLYNRLRWDSPGGVQTNSTADYSTDGFGKDFVKLDYGLVRLDTIVTDNIANELRFQYGRELDDESAQTPTAYDQQFVNGTSYQGLPPQISLQSSNGFSDGTQYYSFRPAYPDERKWQAADTMSWVRGQHSFKFGGDIVHNYDQINSLSLAAEAPNGEYSYTYLGNFFADLAKPSGTCGSSAGEYNVGSLPCYTSFGQNFGKAKFALATTDYGFFFQDFWKPTQRLSLDYGIRYDYEDVPGPYSNLIQATGAYTPLPQFSNRPDDKNNVGPRVGFAYDAFGTGKTVVRGGIGMYYGRMINATLLTAYSSTGSPLAQSSVTFKNSQGGPAFPGIQPADYTPTALAASSVEYFDKHFQNPEALEYDMTVQQQFGEGTVFSMSYLATQSRKLPNFINENLIDTPVPDNNSADGKGYTLVNYTVSGQGGKAATGNNCGPLACNSTYTAKVYNGYINPKFQAITKIASDINASYNALVFQIQNNSFKYATFNASYTWSHSLDDNQNESTQASTNTILDPNAAVSSQYGNSSFNVPNRFVGYALFKYPDFYQTGVRHLLLDGWNLNPLVQIQNGLPYSISTSSYPSSAAVSTGWDGAGGSPTYVPVVGRNTYTLRREEVMDIRAQKDLWLPRHYDLQLIGECFNVFNHENYTAANSTGYIFGGSSTGVATTGYTGPQTYTTELQYQPTFGSYTNANSNYAYSPREVQVAVRLQF
jgi:outer membrane receptor protein involved in Fe transport